MEENVAQIIATLQGHQKQLISDCKMLDELYAQNEQYYHELTLYIIAGELKLQRLRRPDAAQAPFTFRRRISQTPRR